MKVERLSDPPADDPGSDPALVSDEDGRYRSIFENAVEGIY